MGSLTWGLLSTGDSGSQGTPLPTGQIVVALVGLLPAGLFARALYQRNDLPASIDPTVAALPRLRGNVRAVNVPAETSSIKGEAATRVIISAMLEETQSGWRVKIEGYEVLELGLGAGVRLIVWSNDGNGRPPRSPSGDSSD
jgi:hypothetical protein